MSDNLPRLTRDLTEPEPVPAAGIARAIALMQSGRLFRYGEMGTDQRDTALLETEFAALIGRKYCIAVNSGGSALFLALKVCGVRHGDSVLVNGFTLAPVPGSIIHAGAKPVLVEISRDYVIDPDDLRRKAKASGAKFLLLSHMRGHIADMDAVMAIAHEFGITVIEDCAHAIGARWRGQWIGTFGAAAAFSAQTYKHLNAGEGGFLLLDDDHKAARAIVHSGSYMLHGQHLSKPDAHYLQEAGRQSANFSLRMTALAAALLRPQLAELPRRIQQWNAINAQLTAGLKQNRYVYLPDGDPRREQSATSIQFSLPSFNITQMQQFLACAASRGLPIKWFGAQEQAGFTSAPRHWEYAQSNDALPQTHAILATLCDVRTPLSLTKSECDLIVEIIDHAIESVAGTTPSTGKMQQQNAAPASP